MSGPSLRRSASTISGLVLIAVLAGACASSPTPVPPGASPAAGAAQPSTSVNPPTAPTGQSNTPPLIGIFISNSGPVLEVGNGRMLYVHAGDSATASTCLDACATAWPPLMVTAGTTIVAPPPGAKGAFGTITRPDGSSQLTYRNKPLYFYSKDGLGATTGEGINGFTVATP
jgi:predicted lipoprotein with Yx(FWY)xxD motif